MSTTYDNNPGSLRGELLAELARRQPLLAAINLITAFLLTSGLLSAAPAPMLIGWLGYMVISQAARLLCWYLYVRARLPRDSAGWLVASSASAGIGWGLIGILFTGLGSPAQ